MGVGGGRKEGSVVLQLALHILLFFFLSVPHITEEMKVNAE